MRKEKSRFIASVAVSLIAAALVVAPGAWAASTYKILHAFRKSSGGQGPTGNLISDAAGNLYGTTVGGGSSSCYYCGVVFKLMPNPDGTWTEHVLYRFTGGTDGDRPLAGVILDAAGNLYGTTLNGGVGDGVVFELTRSASGGWSERVLHAFLGYGAQPMGGLLRGASGNLYGTASAGTSHGLVFEIKP
jgi:hypothetical protein